MGHPGRPVAHVVVSAISCAWMEAMESKVMLQRSKIYGTLSAIRVNLCL